MASNMIERPKIPVGQQHGLRLVGPAIGVLSVSCDGVAGCGVGTSAADAIMMPDINILNANKKSSIRCLFILYPLANKHCHFRENLSVFALVSR